MSKRHHQRESRRKGRLSHGIQLCVSIVLGAGMAVCSDQFYSNLVRCRCSLVEDWEVAIAFVYPGILGLAAITAGLTLRLLADRRRAWLKSFLATPALYVLIFVFSLDFFRGDLLDSFWPVFALALGLTWPFTYLSFRIARRAPKRDPNAPPTCPKCEYNLTGNVSGICPECGTPIKSA
jgi:hypothetical protein